MSWHSTILLDSIIDERYELGNGGLWDRIAKYKDSSIFIWFTVFEISWDQEEDNKNNQMSIIDVYTRR